MVSVFNTIIYPIIYTLLLNHQNHDEIASRNEWDEDYDFIVIGAGTAGSVVARRLSDDPKVKVLLLEAGRNEDLSNDVPSKYREIKGTVSDWAYETEPQNDCFLNYKGRRAQWPRGKVLGGSSAINGMVYMRGHSRDFTNWENLGCKGWSYRNNLEYFKRSEKNLDQDILANGLHGNSGPFPVKKNKNPDNPTANYFIGAAVELGFNHTDLNGNDTNNAVDIVQQNIVNGTRFSASKSFLESVFRDRKNLHILTQAFVTRIIFSDGRATSVEFRRNGQLYRVNAINEIILSAGTINSPQILLLSGIGPAKHLREMKIPIVADLPGVGQNLHDHAYVLGNPFFFDTPEPELYSDISMERYLTNLTGPLAHFDILEMTMASKYSNDPKWPDMTLLCVGQPGVLTSESIGISDTMEQNMENSDISIGNRPGFMIFSLLGRPKSRGYIKLKSSNPYDYPILQPNYLTHPDDMKVLIEAYKWQFHMASTDMFKRNNVTMDMTLVPGCERVYRGVRKLKNGIMLPSDEYLECVIRRRTYSGWHQVGTCKMGSRNDPMSVVSPKLSVYKVKGLRVIDGSIMPMVTFANSNAPILMIGERGAQFIKDDYNLS